jgi:hypothetical protein
MAKHLMKQEIAQLLCLLQRVDRDPSIPLDNSCPLINDIIELATLYLTSGPDVHEYREELRKAGYPVYPGEVDRFGWLTAYFQLKRGIILFG